MPLDISAIKDVHAHVYFEPGVTEGAAARLRARVADAFPKVLLGRWHAVPIGPHTRAMIIGAGALSAILGFGLAGL